MNGTTTNAEGQGAPRFRFSISKLMLCVLPVAMATSLLTWQMWLPVDRWLLATWLLSWFVGLLYGRVRGNRGIVTATLFGALSGVGATLFLFLFLRRSLVTLGRMTFHEGLLYPVLMLTLFFLVGSLVLAIGCHALLLAAAGIASRASRVGGRGGIAILVTASILLTAAWTLVEKRRWRPFAKLDVGLEAVNSLALSPNGELLATDGTGAVELWQLPSMQRIARYAVDERSVEWIRFSNDSSIIQCGSGYGKGIYFIDVATGERRLVEIDRQGVTHAFACQGELLAVVTDDIMPPRQEVSFWDSDGRRVRSFPLRVSGDSHVMNVEQGVLAYVEGDDVNPNARISVYSLSEGIPVANGPTLPDWGSSFRPCISNDAEWICMYDTLWNPRTGRSYTIPGSGMAFLSDGRLVYVQRVHGWLGMRPGEASGWPLWLQATPIHHRLHELLFCYLRSRIVVHDVGTRRDVAHSEWFHGPLFVWVAPEKALLAACGIDQITLWDVPESTDKKVPRAGSRYAVPQASGLMP